MYLFNRRIQLYTLMPVFLLCLLIPTLTFFSCAKAGEYPEKQEEAKERGQITETSQFIRKAAVSGLFYPSSSVKTRLMITEFLKATSRRDLDGDLKALICPHAAYSCSGSVAAYSYKLLEGKTYDTIILLGPNHRAPLKGVSIWPEGVYRTPLGDVPVNKEIVRHLRGHFDFVTYAPDVHREEHSIELQIPFLQVILKDFQIVPILVGMMTNDQIEALGKELASLLNQHGKLLIVSTDLSHDHTYKEAVSMDRKTTNAIESADAHLLHKMVKSGEAELCGVMPVFLLLEAIRHLTPPVKVSLLKYANSGDILGREGRIVGYAAMSITAMESNSRQQPEHQERGEETLEKVNGLLNEQEKKALLQIARSSISAHLSGQDLPSPEVSEEKLKSQMGVFVTLHKKNGMLRGCIGYIKAVMPLYKAVSECAVSAAVKDYRFPPLRMMELDDIDIEISVLTPLKKISDIKEIQVGEHGLYISRSHYSGILLPQVATEYGWDREQFLAQTCRKAGMQEDSWKKGTDIYIFSAQIFGEKES